MKQGLKFPYVVGVSAGACNYTGLFQKRGYFNPKPWSCSANEFIPTYIVSNILQGFSSID